MKLKAAHLRHNIGGVLSAQGLFAVVVWGASFMATRVALDAMHPLGLVAVRLWTGAVLLLLIVRARGGRLLPQRGDLAVCVFLGAVLSTHLLVQAFGLRYTSAINAGWIVGFMPVTIALGAYLLRKQRLDVLGWSGVTVGTAGVLIVTIVAPPDFAQKDPNNLFLGGPGGTFTEGADKAGILNYTRGRGAALADFNLDGMLDLVEVNYGAPVKVWRNVGTGTTAAPVQMGNWLSVQAAQPGPNRDAIGGWIEVKVGDATQRRELTIGGGHAGGQLGPTHFGLGPSAEAQVRVRWPDGVVGTWMRVTANQRVVIDRGATEARPWSSPTN